MSLDMLIRVRLYMSSGSIGHAMMMSSSLANYRQLARPLHVCSWHTSMIPSVLSCHECRYLQLNLQILVVSLLTLLWIIHSRLFSVEILVMYKDYVTSLGVRTGSNKSPGF